MDDALAGMVEEVVGSESNSSWIQVKERYGDAVKLTVGDRPWCKSYDIGGKASELRPEPLIERPDSEQLGPW